MAVRFEERNGLVLVIYSSSARTALLLLDAVLVDHKDNDPVHRVEYRNVWTVELSDVLWSRSLLTTATLSGVNV